MSVLPEDSKADVLASQAASLAEALLADSLTRTRSHERAEMRRIAGLVGDAESKRFSMAMTDQLWRSQSVRRSVGTLRRLLRHRGNGFGFLDRLLLTLATFGSRFLPGLVLRSIHQRMRRESAQVILPAEAAPFEAYQRKRGAEGVRTNINQLGEAVLGEEEANLRLRRVVALLESPDVDYISVKLSAVFSQINVIAWQATLDHLKERLRLLYRAATAEDNFVNLDMEEYRDLELTAIAFQEVLSEQEFIKLSAGIVLQAYLPDSIRVQRELTAWAIKRREQGGAIIKVRIVKGANLAMEQVDAEWHGWHQVPHACKEDTDACYKQMLEFGCQREHARAVRIGVGSHNLFDIALALTLARHQQVEDAIDIEMLEGMAAPQARAVFAEAGRLLVYSPIVHEEDFGSALAYLVRRLDENTLPGNFLTDLFDLRPGNASWTSQRERFLSAWKDRRTIQETSRRATLPTPSTETFFNEPDTDWTQSNNRARLTAALEGEARTDSPENADMATIEECLAQAGEAVPPWADLDFEERAAILLRCASLLAEQRFCSIALLNDRANKAIAEADTEISEAIDFARYYAQMGEPPTDLDSRPLGTVVIAPPWNFPYAIPCGGILAALVAGNAVILKPAPEAIAIGWHLVNQLWDAGVPREVLQFVHCEDGQLGRKLITDSRTCAVVLTGSHDTAAMFREWRPSLALFAETSGKNAILVSAMADRELAARDLVKSAFYHAGQKCSAASLGILEAEVYDDRVFRRQLKDAAASLCVGLASDLASIVTPLVQEPSADLRRALTALEEGEKWLLEPKQDPNNTRLWSPGIKLGVRPESWFHQTECFGPVLGLMRARDLDDGLAIQNGVRFGLTAGFHSLESTEVRWWQDRVEAGNLYINRGITGAIVQRQPFGGWKASNVGPGAKAGGPNYVNLFRTLCDRSDVDVTDAESNYRKAWQNYFEVPEDPSGLKCERNTFRYHSRKGVLLRLIGKDDAQSESLAKAASAVTNVPLFISHLSDEPSSDLAERLACDFPDGTVLRTIGGELENDVLLAAAKASMKWIDAPFCANGRIELTRWTEEQVVCETRHRYGNIF